MGGEGAGLDEVGELFEIAGAFGADEGGQSLAEERREGQGPQLPVDAARPAPALFAAGDDGRPGGRERAA